MNAAPPQTSAHLALSGWLALAASLFTLNLAVTFHNQWPTAWITTRHELSVELALLLLVLCVLAEGRRLPGRHALNALAGVFVLFTLARYAEVTAPALFGRRINLYWDASHLPSVVRSFMQAASTWTQVLVPPGFLAGLVLLFLALRGCLFQVRRGLTHPPARRAMALGALGMCAAWYSGMHGARTLQWFSLPVTATYAQQLEFIHDAVTGADVSANLDQAALAHVDLSHAKDADLLVLFLESYGAVAFDRHDVAERLREDRARLATSLADAGLVSASAFIGSPTFGGASWLAHASLLTGIEIRDNASHAALLTRSRDTLVHRFREQGWRTVAVMPGLKRAWPEGGFYGFDRIYGERALDYRGPDFGWWRIPDQFTLAKLAAMELDRMPRKPLFAFYPTISTHAPFRPVPPYQPDWTRVLSASPFDLPALRASLAQDVDFNRQDAAYAQSLGYALHTLAGFIEQRAQQGGARELLIVALGDHQPPANVSGAAARHDVPVHIITRPGTVHRVLLAQGFSAGLEPAAGPLMPMHRLGPLLLRALSRQRARSDDQGLRPSGTTTLSGL